MTVVRTLAYGEERPGVRGGSLDADSIRVLIVDDHVMVAEALRSGLSAAGGIEVTGSVATVEAALGAIATDAPDVVIVDYHLPGEDSMQAVATITSQHPQTRVLVFSGRSDPPALARALEAGCSWYLVKEGSLAEFIDGVRRVHRGEMVFAPDLLREGLERLSRSRWAPGVDLTPRELDVLRLLAEGLGVAKIAAELGVSVHTVRNHTQNILTKLGVHSRLEAVSTALREGIIEAP